MIGIPGAIFWALLALPVPQAGDLDPPAPVRDLEADPPNTDVEFSIRLTWTSPGAGLTYDLRYRREGPILTEEDFEAAVPRPSFPSSAGTGGEESYRTDTLQGTGGYHFALKYRDGEGPWSALSNSTEGWIDLFHYEEVPDCHGGASGGGSSLGAALLALLTRPRRRAGRGPSRRGGRARCGS